MAKWNRRITSKFTPWTCQGIIRRLTIHQGDTVTQGQVIAEISQPGVEEELQSAEARKAQAQADLSTLTAGGRSADLAEIDGNLAVLRQQCAAEAQRRPSFRSIAW